MKGGGGEGRVALELRWSCSSQGSQYAPVPKTNLGQGKQSREWTG